jgi:hypothetical protein
MKSLDDYLIKNPAAASDKGIAYLKSRLKMTIDNDQIQKQGGSAIIQSPTVDSAPPAVKKHESAPPDQHPNPQGPSGTFDKDGEHFKSDL